LDNQPEISVCIPAYEMGGLGGVFLSHSLDILARQTFDRFEVIVSDQSQNDDIAAICRRSDVPVRRIDARSVPRGASGSINHAMAAARGRIVKILFQDDYLLGDDALGRIALVFDTPSVNWCLTGSQHTRDGVSLDYHLIPRWHDQIHFGLNTVSSPSVLAMRKTPDLWFDTQLVWLMDVDFFKRCASRWGPPTLLPDPLVVNRLHGGQVSAGVSPALIRRELRYIRDKYRSEMDWSDWLHWLGRMCRTVF
jgi:glycosyltransferase involved in cell wall biosynthesis